MFQQKIENNFNTRFKLTALRMQKIQEILTHIRNNALEIHALLHALLNNEDYQPSSVAHNVVFFFKTNTNALSLLNTFLTNQQQVMIHEELYIEFDKAFKELIAGDPENKSAKNNMQLMLNFFENNPEILPFFEENLSTLENIYSEYKTWCGNQTDRRKVEKVIYQLVPCINEHNKAAFDNLQAVMKNSEIVSLSDEAKALLQTPPALYAFAHITHYTFYKLNTSPVPKVIRDFIKTPIKPYEDLVATIRLAQIRDETPVREASAKLEKIAKECAAFAKNKNYLDLAKACMRYEKAEIKLMAAVKTTEDSVIKFKKIQDALDKMLYEGKVDLPMVYEINQTPQLNKYRDILLLCMRPGKNTASDKLRPIAQLPENTITLIDDSISYTTILHHACQKYISENMYSPLSDHLDLAKKIIDFLTMKSAVISEVASQYILCALNQMLRNKSRHFLIEINKSFNYENEIKKFQSDNILYQIIEKLSISNAPLQFDTNAFIPFAIKYYPQRITEIILKLPGKQYKQITFDRAVDHLVDHAIQTKNWNYLLKFSIRLFTVNQQKNSSCFNIIDKPYNNTSFEKWMTSTLSYALKFHDYDAAVFQDIFRVLRALHLRDQVIKEELLEDFFMHRPNNLKTLFEIAKIDMLENESLYFWMVKKLEPYKFTLLKMSEWAFFYPQWDVFCELKIKPIMPGVTLPSHVFLSKYGKINAYHMISPLLTWAIEQNNLDCLKKWFPEWCYIHEQNARDKSLWHPKIIITNYQFLLKQCITSSRSESFDYLFSYFMVNEHPHNSVNIQEDEIATEIVSELLREMNASETLSSKAHACLLKVIFRSPLVTLEKDQILLKTRLDKPFYFDNAIMKKGFATIVSREEKIWNRYRLFAHPEFSNIPKEVKDIIGQYLDKLITDPSIDNMSPK